MARVQQREKSALIYEYAKLVARRTLGETDGDERMKEILTELNMSEKEILDEAMKKRTV